MRELQRLPAEAGVEAIIAAIEADGAVIIERLAGEALIDAIAAELAPYIEATPFGGDPFVGVSTRRTGALAARSAGCRDLIMHPAVLGACDKFLLPNCLRYQLHVTQAIAIGPGQPKQPLHRDRGVWGNYLRAIEPQLNTIWAMTDFTHENGATQVVPGSQAWPGDREATEAEVCFAEMPRGSVLIYTGTVLHGGGANASNGVRVGLNITYALGWLRQEENQYLSCPPDVAKDLDPALQALLGYSMGGYALGYFSPPLPPGQGPETAPPDYAVGGSDSLWGANAFETPLQPKPQTTES